MVDEIVNIFGFQLSREILTQKYFKKFQELLIQEKSTKLNPSKNRSNLLYLRDLLAFRATTTVKFAMRYKVVLLFILFTLQNYDIIIIMSLNML